MGYHHSQYQADGQDHRGWFIGSFMENPAARTDVVEIKYTEFPVGPTEHGLKTSGTFECSIMVSGKARAIIGDDEKIWQAGDFIAIEPGTPNNLVLEILEPVQIFTVKAPCDPTAKKVIG
ncbi:hypothetical protein KC976_03355 [Candidatus Saccharibacteria bacterium]|nr:hypothetical protein [Candidatus Saccharibacteria bacterium]HPG37384.1 hypothetical protein [Candidatus Saccharibacteria bacterium]